MQWLGFYWFTLPLLQVTVFAVAVGGNIYEEELRTIASEPKCSHVYFLAAFNDITAFTNQIMNGACKGRTSISSKDLVLFITAAAVVSRKKCSIAPYSLI